MRYHFRNFAPAALACLLALSLATGASADSHSATRVYAGLALSFSALQQPGLGAVVGVRATRLNAGDRLLGVDANVRYDLRRGFERVAVGGLIGRPNAHLNLGGGFNLLGNELFVTGAAQTRHLRAGVDYGVMTGNAGGYFEVNTLRRPRR
jgi:hypothetical protein